MSDEIERRLNVEPRLTSRDVLEMVAGPDHAIHTVMNRSGIYRGSIKLYCSCGDTFEAPAKKDVTDGLRNVPVKG